MSVELKLNILSQVELSKYLKIRTGETKCGEKIKLLDPVEENNKLSDVELRRILEKHNQSGVRYAILGIPEDIGSRANCGRGGSADAWPAFLASFVNHQVNKCFDPSQIILLGNIELDDLQQQAVTLDPDQEGDLNQLRELCEELDNRVLPIVKILSASNITPIIIGGSHNNVFPIQKAVYEAQKELDPNFKGLACANCDAHADFRQAEGRHSGNGFRYSYLAEILQAYFVFGLHENFNSQTILDELKACNFDYNTYEDIYVRRNTSLEQAVNETLTYLSKAGLLVGIDLDLDSIAYMPASAETACGISNEDAAYFIHKLAISLPTAYLHLTEAAPKWRASEGLRHVGRSLALQVITYINAKNKFLE